MYNPFRKKKQCKHCNQIVTGRHYCSSMDSYVSYDSTDDLILFMEMSDTSSSACDDSCGCSGSHDYSSSSCDSDSYDSGSSCDSGGSCGGCD